MPKMELTERLAQVALGIEAKVHRYVVDNRVREAPSATHPTSRSGIRVEGVECQSAGCSGIRSTAESSGVPISPLPHSENLPCPPRIIWHSCWLWGRDVCRDDWTITWHATPARTITPVCSKNPAVPRAHCEYLSPAWLPLHPCLLLPLSSFRGT